MVGMTKGGEETENTLTDGSSTVPHSLWQELSQLDATHVLFFHRKNVGTCK